MIYRLRVIRAEGGEGWRDGGREGKRKRTLNGVVQGEDVHALPVGYVGAGGERHEVTQTDAEVLADHLF